MENGIKSKKKPSIVFCHGIWADGSWFNKLIPALQAEGYEVIAAQYGLDSLASDVATVKHTLGRVSSPAILAGHSYGLKPDGIKHFAGPPPSRSTAVMCPCSPNPSLYWM